MRGMRSGGGGWVPGVNGRSEESLAEKVRFAQTPQVSIGSQSDGCLREGCLAEGPDRAKPLRQDCAGMSEEYHSSQCG